MDYLSSITDIVARKKTIAAPSSELSNYAKWYSGTPTSWHKYSIFNGKRNIHRTRLSMRMAKQVAEDWASLLMNEKVSIGVKNQKLLEHDLIENDFYNRANKAVEYAFGLSMAALVVDLENLVVETPEGETVGKIIITENTKATINVYSALKIVPITFVGCDLTECAFIQESTEKTKITAHLINDKTAKYEIVVANYDNKTGAISDIYVIPTNSNKPLFAIIHPQLVNNIDLDSPYPIPIFANSIDTLKSLDAKYDSYANEFLLGRKRIFVSSEINKVDKDTGAVEQNFDPNDMVFSSIPKAAMLGANNGNPFIYVSNDALRSAEHSQAIQDDLNFLSKQCGLGVDYYRFEKGRVMTATQVISEKSDTFRNLKKHEGVVEKALFTIIPAFMFAHDNFTTASEKYDNYEITVQFDDSIIEDKDTEKTNDQKEVAFGVMSLIDYRIKWYAEDEEKAKAYVKRIYGDADFLKRLSNYTPFLTQGVITPLEFVKKVYLDITEESKQIALAEEIKENLKSGAEVFSDAELMNFRTNTATE